MKRLGETGWFQVRKPPDVEIGKGLAPDVWFERVRGVGEVRLQHATAVFSFILLYSTIADNGMSMYVHEHFVIRSNADTDGLLQSRQVDASRSLTVRRYVVS